jgi:hypothetical protein
MSIQVGRANPRVRINKFVLFEMLSFVFKDFQMLELLLKLCRASHKIAVDNRALLVRMCGQRGMVFSLRDSLSLVDPDFLERVSLLKFSGSLTLGDSLDDARMLARMNPRKVFIERLAI